MPAASASVGYRARSSAITDVAFVQRVYTYQAGSSGCFFGPKTWNPLATTLDELEGPLCTLFQSMRLLEPTIKI